MNTPRPVEELLAVLRATPAGRRPNLTRAEREVLRRWLAFGRDLNENDPQDDF